MEWAEELTAENERITLFVAFNYGGRAEILDAARTLQRAHRGGVPRPTCTRPRCTTPT
jgi:undecaprenyl diphosphate synthase